MFNSLPSFIFTWDFWNTAIAVIALIISIYSIWYTHKNDEFTLQITNAGYYLDDELPPMLSFDIFNNSSKAITIEKLRIYNKDGDSIELLLNFDQDEFYEELVRLKNEERRLSDPFGLDISSAFHTRHFLYPNSYSDQEPFTKSEIIPANDSVDYSYYINPMVTPLKIEIEADQRINKFRKTKSFIVHFDKFD